MSILLFIVAGLFVGVSVSFLYPWHGDRKPKQRKFSGAGVGWSKPEQLIEKAPWDNN